MSDESILTINGGSSSIKFAVFHVGDSLLRGLTGKVDRIGCSGTRLTFRDETETVDVKASDDAAAVDFLVGWLNSKDVSYAYLMQELRRLGDPAATSGRVILAHLGNGASMAAVRDGQCMDTSMGFTPSAGLPMSTRSGDLDPGLFR